MSDYLTSITKQPQTSGANACDLACMLKWQQDKLLVRRSSIEEHSCLLSTLENQERLIECLKNSPVKLVSLDRDLGEGQLKYWADACEQAGKPVFIQLPSLADLPRKSRPRKWILKRLVDVIFAAVLLPLLSPILLLVALLVRISSPGPIFFQQWRVGKRGKLFRVLKFRTMVADADVQHHEIMADLSGLLHKRDDDPRITPIGRWLRKYSLDELPQFINVVRGEMSLVGPRPWALYDAVRINEKQQRRLNARPGITGLWQVKARSHVLDIETVNHWDLEYLKSWSIRKDLKLLLMTIPKVLSGFGAQ